MQIFVIFAIGLLSAAHSADSTFEDSWDEDFLESQSSALNTFERFLDFWQRPYRSDPAEKAKRFEVFMKTLIKIDERNAHEERHNPHPNRARHGITKFADWTDGEFQALLGGSSKNKKPVQKLEEEHLTAPKTTKLPAMELPAKGDSASGRPQAPCTTIHPTGLRDSGIRNQGQCGDCWAFSTTETLRSTYIREHGEDPGELSTQYLVDCSPRAAAVCPSSEVPSVGGCCGGWPEDAYEFIHSSGGIPTAAEYGDLYLNRTDTGLAEFSETGTSPIISSWKGITFSGVNPDTQFACKSNVPKKVTGTNLQALSSESAMAEHACNTGSISIALATEGWNTYKSGVLSASTCGTIVDHAVMIVGMNASANAWIVQNSWGSDFGVSAEGGELPSSETGIVIEADGASQAMFGGGYIYIAYGDNACDITSSPIVVSGTRLV